MTELARIEPPARIPVAQIMGEIMQRGIDPSAAANAMEKLVQLQREDQAAWNKQQFYAAFSAAKSKIKTINAEKAIPDKAGNVKWHYAPLEDLQDAIDPVLQAHQLDYRFSSRREGSGNICTATCFVWHKDGHEVTSECSVNVANAEGGDLGALKKAKRGALVAMFGLKSRHMEEDDPRILGDFITPSEAQELQARLDALGAIPGTDAKRHAWYVGKLLEFAKEGGVVPSDFTKVYSSALPRLQREITQVETKRKPSPPDGAAAPRNVPSVQTTVHSPTGTGEEGTSPVAGDRTHTPSMGVQAAEAVQPLPPISEVAAGREGPDLSKSQPAQSLSVRQVEAVQPTAGAGNVTNDAASTLAKCATCGAMAVADGKCGNCGGPKMTRNEARKDAEKFAESLDMPGKMAYIIEAAGSPSGSPLNKAWIKAKQLQKIGTRGVADLLSGEKEKLAGAIRFYFLSPE